MKLNNIIIFIMFTMLKGQVIFSDTLGIGDSKNSVESKTSTKISELNTELENSQTGIEFKNKTANSFESASSPDSSRVVSYFPYGVRGDEGLPMVSWGLTWTGLEKNQFINKYFKSFKVSHNYKGEMMSHDNIKDHVKVYWNVFYA